MSAPPAAAAPGESDVPLDNPDLDRACGIDIEVILDESSSVRPYRDDVQRAFRAFTGALNNTGSRLAVSEFSTEARLPLAGAAQQSYTPVTDATVASTFEPYITNGYVPDGSTHWEDAFRVSRYFLPRPNPSIPHLVVFITDGNPNRVVNNARVTYDPGNPDVAANEYENKVPLIDLETGVADSNPATDRAVSNANAVKADGSHILTVAVGDGLSGSGTLDRLTAVSGPDVYDGSGTFDISTTDIYRQEVFSQLEVALRDAAFQLCAPSVTVRKLVDDTPDTGVEDAVPGAGYGMTAEVTPQPNSWVLPAGASGSTASTTTDVNGFAGFQWDTDAGVSPTVTVTEQDPSAIVPGLAFDPSLTRCTYRTPDVPDTPLPTTPTALGFTTTVPFEAIVTCTIYNRLAEDPSIDLEKLTNGADADDAPGPTINLGAPVDWDYVVTNTGSVTLSNLQVSDDQGVTVTCPATSVVPAASVTCTASGTAAPGPYANLGTATATSPGGVDVDDSDPSHYVGGTPAIDIEKATNGEDADAAPGPFVPPGSTVDWTYLVTNVGSVDLTGVSVTDDQGVVVTCPQTTLVPAEAMTCTASGTAVAGQYRNTATATGTGPGPVVVQDADDSHYFGEDPEVGIVKYTNGDDADVPTGPIVMVGDPVVWTYVMTNTGNVPLTTTVSDSDPGVAVLCPRQVLVPGNSLVCRAIGTAVAGQYANVGTVAASTPSGTVLTTSDPSHYFGAQPEIDIEKATNGVDADFEPGPFVEVGDPVTWTYVVTNLGNVTLTGIEVVDTAEGPIACPATTLAPGAAMNCTAAGTATAGQYANDSRVTATGPLGGQVGDADPSHYFGASPGIDLQKSTNGFDADVPTGPFIAVGGEVDWVYEVTNTGNVTLDDLTVVDDQVGSVTASCGATSLTPGASTTCTALGVGGAGQYANSATATATDTNGVSVSDDDDSHYYGYETSVALEKRTNGEDADTPTGPLVAQGGPVEWTYEVTNTGDIPVLSYVVTDSDPAVTVTCPDVDIPPGDAVTCRATGTAGDGQYANTATVVALDQFEHELTAEDPSHYLGAAPAVDVEKATNGEDADVAPGPTLRVGDPVTWTYVVTNVGDAPLSSVSVTDDRLGPITCPVTELAPSATTTCTATGTVEAGPYVNVATVTASFEPTGADPVTVSDRDPSHHLGANPLGPSPVDPPATPAPADPAGTGAGGTARSPSVDLAPTGAEPLLLLLAALMSIWLGVGLRRIGSAHPAPAVSAIDPPPGRRRR